MTAQEIRDFILTRLEKPLAALNLTPEMVPDDFDLFTEGIIDSFGLLELAAAVENELGLSVDFEELDTDSLTVIGPLSRYIEEKSRSPRVT